MHYLIMVYENEQWAKLPPAEKLPVHQACGAWHDDLVRSGHSRGALGLEPSAASTTLRERNGQVTITDGPFAETKEILGGFEIVEVLALDEALAIAKRFPSLRAGLTVEVRPVKAASVHQLTAGIRCDEAAAAEIARTQAASADAASP